MDSNKMADAETQAQHDAEHVYVREQMLQNLTVALASAIQGSAHALVMGFITDEGEMTLSIVACKELTRQNATVDMIRELSVYNARMMGQIGDSMTAPVQGSA